jgi:hypothetical protein
MPLSAVGEEFFRLLAYCGTIPGCKAGLPLCCWIAVMTNRTWPGYIYLHVVQKPLKVPWDGASTHVWPISCSVFTIFCMCVQVTICKSLKTRHEQGGCSGRDWNFYAPGKKRTRQETWCRYRILVYGELRKFPIWYDGSNCKVYTYCSLAHSPSVCNETSVWRYKPVQN